MEIKTCSNCKQQLPIDKFNRLRKSYNAHCKQCCLANGRKNYIRVVFAIDKIDGEIWVPVDGYEGFYVVSNMGRVKSVKRNDLFIKYKVLPERLLTQFETKVGYRMVVLSLLKVKKHFLVHRLVAKAFIPNPDNKRTVNHKDGNKQNNIVDNLEWNTHGENHIHAYKTGLRKSTLGKKRGKRLAA